MFIERGEFVIAIPKGNGVGKLRRRRRGRGGRSMKWKKIVGPNLLIHKSPYSSRFHFHDSLTNLLFHLIENAQRRSQNVESLSKILTQPSPLRHLPPTYTIAQGHVHQKEFFFVKEKKFILDS